MRVSVGFFNQEVSDLGERKSTNTGLQSAVTQAYTGTVKCVSMNHVMGGFLEEVTLKQTWRTR